MRKVHGTVQGCLQTSILQRALTASEFKSLLEKYNAARKRPMRGVTDQQKSLAIEFRKSNLTQTEFSKKRGISYWKLQGILHRVALDEFLSK